MSRQPAWRTSHAGLPRARPRATDHTTDTRQTLVNPAEVQPSHSLSSSVLRPTPPQQHLYSGLCCTVLYCAAQALEPQGPPPAEGGGRGAKKEGALRPRLGAPRPAASASLFAFALAASSASLAASSASSSAKRAAVASAAALSSSDVAELPLLFITVFGHYEPPKPHYDSFTHYKVHYEAPSFSVCDVAGWRQLCL